MKIVMDSNIFCGDYFLRGSSSKVFLDGLNSLPGKLLIPEVVVDEVVNRYREDLQEIAIKERDVRNALGRMLMNSSEPSHLNLNVEARVATYRKFLEEIVRKYGEILPYPTTPHKEIVERDLARKKPFKRDGSGYRDLLIWETMKSQMHWGIEKVVFLTNNPKDFGEGPLVDPELQPEILNPDRLKLIRSLREFNEEFIIPRLKMIEGLNAETLAGDAAGLDIVSWLRSNLRDILYFEESLGPVVVGFPDGVGSVTPIEIVAFHKLKIEDAHRLDSGETLVRINLEVEIEFSIDIDWEDFINHPEVREWAGASEEAFSSSTSHLITNICLSLDLVLSKGDGAVDSHDLISIASDYGSAEFK